MSATLPHHAPVPAGNGVRPRRWKRGLLLAAMAGLGLNLCGCNSTFRRMTIRSEPAGALVILDGKEVGRTPYTSDFLYYGTRDLTLVKDGYRTLSVPIKFGTPWYQIPPLDFVTDNFLPITLTNRHDFCFNMQPQDPLQGAEIDALRQRAGSLRSESQVGP